LKRALYSIPLVGLSLTGGCKGDDAIVNTWGVDAAFSRPNPFSGQGVDIGGGTICDVDVLFGDMTINEDLTGQLTYDLTFSNCNVAERNGVFNYLYDAQVNILESNKRYQITLVDSVAIQFNTVMECTIDEETLGQLDCNDDNLQSWIFTAAP
jgi:hypothetical protein